MFVVAFAAPDSSARLSDEDFAELPPSKEDCQSQPQRQLEVNPMLFKLTL